MSVTMCVTTRHVCPGISYHGWPPFSDSSCDAYGVNVSQSKYIVLLRPQRLVTLGRLVRRDERTVQWHLLRLLPCIRDAVVHITRKRPGPI
jgi:hypothetical protein